MLAKESATRILDRFEDRALVESLGCKLADICMDSLGSAMSFQEEKKKCELSSIIIDQLNSLPLGRPLHQNLICQLRTMTPGLFRLYPRKNHNNTASIHYIREEATYSYALRYSAGYVMAFLKRKYDAHSPHLVRWIKGQSEVDDSSSSSFLHFTKKRSTEGGYSL